MRLDRLATLHFYRPMNRLFAARQMAAIPILMYHAVQEGSSHRNPYYDTNVSPKMFASQIRQLREQGFRAVSVDQAVAALHQEKRDEKLVVLTFDDGYRDFYENAYPILAEAGFTATVYLMTGFMDGGGKTFKDLECLTWPQVRELHAKGIAFGSHTVSHPYLKLIGMPQVEQELATSKKMIEDRMGAAIDSFSYPYAFPEASHEFKRQLRDLLMRHGYANGVTTILGTANSRSDALFLPRLPVNNWDDINFFQAKLEGAYNWLHYPQYLSKLANRLRPEGHKLRDGKHDVERVVYPDSRPRPEGTD